MKTLIDDSYQFEKYVNKSHGNFLINGAIDAINEESHTLYEFKFTQDIDDEHILQAVLYYYLYHDHTNHLDQNQLLVYIIKSNQLLRITEIKDIEKIVSTLLYQKFEKKARNLTNQQFIEHSHSSNSGKISDDYLLEESDDELL